jgi:hypothetical protein
LHHASDSVAETTEPQSDSLRKQARASCIGRAQRDSKFAAANSAALDARDVSSEIKNTVFPASEIDGTMT